MILHLLHNRKVFFEIVYNLFELVNPLNNRYYIFLEGDEKPDTEFQRLSPNIKFLKYSDLNNEHLEDFISYDGVIIHRLNLEKAKLVNRLKNKINFIWFSWGGDLLDLIFFNSNKIIYQRETSKLLKEIQYLKLKSNSKELLINIFKLRLFKQIIFREGYYFEARKALKKINYYSTIIPNEKEYLLKYVKNFNAIYTPFSYGHIDHFINFNQPSIPSERPNILIGHSGWPLGNHVESFNILKNIDNGLFNYICPLNYGSSEYCLAIKKLGFSIFGKRFQPITEFLPLDKYVNLLNTCNAAIINTNVQSAIGNIIILIILQIKIYLNDDSLTYKYLNENGIVVFPFNSKLSLSELEIKLDKYNAENNIKKINQLYGKAFVENKVKDIVNIIVNHKNKK